MMILTAIIGGFFAATQVIPGTGPNQRGRAGNDYLKQEKYEEAAEAYRKGLSSYQDQEKTGPVYHGLQNNLGLTLHRQENFEDAERAFDEALASAPNLEATTMAAFNAGNNAFTHQQLERALEHYRTALMADPDNEDAKFNFEFVSRQLQEQENQDQQSESDNQQEEQSDQEESEQNDQENQDGESNEQQSEQQENEQEQASEQNESEQTEEESPQEQSTESTKQQETPLTREQAERILEALENEEEQLLREIQKVEGRPKRVAKDW
ncbi:MAG: tetratricopeptide repeat protein [Bacteroidetes bacterium]|nr:tetratricopeptide repeat protein [Bacteroidota bacterium]MCY4204210.1 tetratricopeptide repeat protein [Bacteroidota bacterium]